ncbi:hypothetical protein NDU88_005643 [Pleurodeles waltl]|uniref:Uncharacterized protein n=1 Tax=Pleurodeles waltl TaxID=8319 RepID=A0AAV7W8M9_PLEWA|nr:hypothetical protein NDU88_005643 [Pleurodeles waltl]
MTGRRAIRAATTPRVARHLHLRSAMLDVASTSQSVSFYRQDRLGHASLSSTLQSPSLEAQMDMKNLLLSLKEEIRGKLLISERNQEKIKETRDIIENKIGILMERMEKMEIALEELDK